MTLKFIFMSSNLNRRIQDFYDRSTQLWLETWGEHMHHGYYGADGRERKSNLQAQVDMIEELLRWGKVDKAARILDAGCGVGGSARFLASRYGAEVLGVTLSPVQAERARLFTEHARLDDRVRFEVRDMMTLEPADGPFDLIWSMESAEHLPDKAAMLQHFFELLAPGGRLLIATWCHRTVPPALDAGEEALLAKVYDTYNVPPFISIDDYEALIRDAGFQSVAAADWSPSIAPFWGAVIRSAFSLHSLSGLLRSGWPTIRGAWGMQYMRRGFRKKTITFGVFQGQKP